MKTFEVTITATITKTYSVEAEDTQQTYDNAHEIFSLLTDDVPEYYDQTTDSIIEVK
jgi:hypothetical protein